MKNFVEELEKIDKITDLNLKRQRKMEILMESLENEDKESDLLDNEKMWEGTRANTLDLHFYHCQNVAPLIKVTFVRSHLSNAIWNILFEETYQFNIIGQHGFQCESELYNF